ncbi:MAG: hypothetical protein MUP80_01675 [Acidobacteriia bacterium]|nr:hypothetical protein [Terriglobia bacterium]
MKKPSRLKHLVPVALALAVLAVIAARAGGPLYVGGPPPFAPGVPFVWTINPLTYWTDLGYLGVQTNQQADALVADAFKVWQDVATANISFAKDASNNGKLGADVTADNIMAVLNSIEGCGALGSIAKDRSIIYDVDGTAVAALLGEENKTTVLGFASVACASSNGVDSNYYLRGYAVLNGIFLDGVNNATNPEVTVTGFKAVMIHEFGHLIGLDHSQINLNCLTSYCAPGSDDLEGVPTMFPVLINDAAMSTLATDDIAAISALYPESTFPTSTGRITGHVFFSDGQTPAQGFNVIARSTTSPLVTAVSSVSGFLYTVDVGNPVYPWWGSEYGSRDPALIGFYDMPGLPPGDYTVEVEAINNSGDHPFVDGSSVGPIGNYGFQFPLPSLLPTLPCTPEYLVSGATATCNRASATPLPVVAGSPVTGTDVILIGTPPRYDAWEDGP